MKIPLFLHHIISIEQYGLRIFETMGNHYLSAFILSGGFDSQRMCSCKIGITRGEFAGYPINITRLIEDYPPEKEEYPL